MFTNSTKAKLKAGETVQGCFVRYPDATLIEVLALLGWDYMVFDGEHGPIDPRDCENMVRAAELHGVTPIVRVTTNQQPTILRYMDSGAHGALVPWVNSGAEAEAVVRSVKYWPRGQRGLAGVRANGYGLTTPLGEYVGQANAETLVIVQVETATAVGNIAEIVAVPDIDVVFIGPNDLAQSLGLPGQTKHPTVRAEMDKVIKALDGTGKALGIMVGNAEDARAWRDLGARFISVAMDNVLAPAVREYLRVARA